MIVAIFQDFGRAFMIIAPGLDGFLVLPSTWTPGRASWHGPWGGDTLAAAGGPCGVQRAAVIRCGEFRTPGPGGGWVCIPYRWS